VAIVNKTVGDRISISWEGNQVLDMMWNNRLYMEDVSNMINEKFTEPEMSNMLPVHFFSCDDAIHHTICCEMYHLLSCQF